jgi:hypothetical protein
MSPLAPALSEAGGHAPFNGILTPGLINSGTRVGFEWHGARVEPRYRNQALAHERGRLRDSYWTKLWIGIGLFLFFAVAILSALTVAYVLIQEPP